MNQAERIAIAIENLFDVLLEVAPEKAHRLAESYCPGCVPVGGVEAEQAQENGWVSPCDHPGDWYEIRVVFPGCWDLTDDEIGRVFGCLGYALRCHLRGEDLSEPEVVENSPMCTVLEYSYDSTKSRSDDIGAHLDDAFDAARRFIVEGTPVRTTDRSGPWTRGTRLVEGVPRLAKCPISFFVR